MVSMAKLFIPVLVLSLAAYAETEETGLISIMPGDGSVIIENVNGEIHLLPGHDPSVQVEWKIVYADEGDQGRILVLHDDTDGLHVWTEVQEGDSPGAEVDFIVSVPPGSDYEYILETVNGDIEVRDCSGFAMISAVNGDISTRAFDGILWLEVVNGEVAFEDCPGIRAVEVVNGEIQGLLGPLEGDLTLDAVNGDIGIGIPEGSAAILIETVTGNIDIEGYEDAVIITETVGEYAEFGDGEFSLIISTVSGDIEVRDTE